MDHGKKSNTSNSNSFILNPDGNNFGLGKEPRLVVTDKEDTFYSLCTVERTCCGKIKYGRFKDRNHALLCTVFGCMSMFFMIAVIVPLVIYALVDMGIDEQVAIDGTGNPNYKSWQNNVVSPGSDDVQISYSLHFFDLQNPADVVKGAKPVVVERGPYVYDEYFQKFDIEWTDGGNVVTYNTYRYYIYNSEKSGPGLSEYDNITLPYAAVLGFEYLLTQVPESVQQIYTYKMITGLEKEKIGIEHQLTELYDQISAKTLPPQKKSQILQKLRLTNNSMQLYFNDLESYFSKTEAGQVIFKNFMCAVPSGISPFSQFRPSDAWFGYLNDPLLLQVSALLATVKELTNVTVPWSAAIPGAAINYSSIADTRRRRTPDTLYTGKKNKHQIAQYIRYQNMTLMHTCIEPTKGNMSAYNEGTEFPACDHFQYEWDEETAAAKGYTLPFATDYANRIAGSDANQYGRPLTNDKFQVFISDIYRSAYLKKQKMADWYGIPVKRFAIQSKDMENSTINPANEQYFMFGPSGILNTTKAANVPVFISFPHFYLADNRLVAAIEGLNPQESVHETYIDVEPQTGLLTSARKRLQVNYLMEDYAIPEVLPETVDLGYAVCANLTETIAEIEAIPGLNIDVPDFVCNVSIVTDSILCLSQPSTWTFQQGGVYMPFGWVSEEVTLPESDANDLQNTLFIMGDVAEGVRLWSLIAGGFCFAMLCAMLTYNYLSWRQQHSQLDWYKHALRNNGNGNPVTNVLDFGVSVHDPLNQGAQPLLQDEDASNHYNPSAPGAQGMYKA